MNILYYSWQENSAADMLATLQGLGHFVKFCLHDLSYYFSDEFSAHFQEDLSNTPYDFIFTFNYIPSVSNAAESSHMPYVSWVYDCPHVTLYDCSLHNSCNYIFLFDRNMYLTVLANHAKHAYHHPLAINPDRLAKHLSLSAERSNFFPENYQHNLSFVGSLYEKTAYGSLQNVSPHLQGYLQGIISAQKQVWGVDLISAVLSPKRVAEIYSFLPFIISEHEFITAKDAYTGIIQKQITSEERIEAINLLSELTPVALYTASDTSPCPMADSLGILSYTSQMPDVFHHSKINLNITLRSITSGIPLRAVDILGCGGFLMTNYQPELAEFLTPDKDFVYFEDMNDLKKKAAYYLAHDREREDIAYHGYQSVIRLFSYQKQVQRMLDIVSSALEDI